MRDESRLVKAGRSESDGGRVRFSEGAREAARRHAEARLAEGRSLAEAAQEMGVGYETLRRWRGAGKLRPVTVSAEPVTPPIVVVLPCGARIEGLDLAGTAELARRLA